MTDALLVLLLLLSADHPTLTHAFCATSGALEGLHGG